ncbi:hypothetical protein PORY_000889 [Pneumocystis oryctolagi]|uniref:Uncharacterized protein n=1 Tax=Pneumocystis oryctolagi TaxID=42067 RepID=A0ACB7CDZ6_9ASCO|nr:hypothetical protein PORY_000889 [Pneumocystis oryctolagi]
MENSSAWPGWFGWFGWQTAVSYTAAYLLGGATLGPIVLCVWVWWGARGVRPRRGGDAGDAVDMGGVGGAEGGRWGRRVSKTGWLRVAEEEEGVRRRGVLFFGVLKEKELLLYDRETRAEVRHRVRLRRWNVGVWPAEVTEGEVFARKHAICLTEKTAKVSSATDVAMATDRVPVATVTSTQATEVTAATTSSVENTEKSRKRVGRRRRYFIFNTNPSEQEDWYFSLIEASQEEEGERVEPLGFDAKHMSKLIQTIHSNDAQLQVRWLNALLGRLFLGLYRLPFFEEFLVERIKKKISKVKKPGFLSEIVVKKVDVGDSMPYITNPRLRDLSADGQLNIDVTVTYTGCFRVEIATSATLSLGSRFKPRQVDLVLAVLLKKFEGTLALIIKPPPSNRFWFGFYDMPKMDMTIEPVVFSKQITYSMILKVIENRIRETIHSTLVFPYMADFEFCTPEDQILKGGIWNCFKPRTDELKKNEPEAEKQNSNEEAFSETPFEHSKTESIDSSKVCFENDIDNKSKHTVLLPTLRSSGSELKKNSLKRSSSYGTISTALESQTHTEIVADDRSFKEFSRKPFVTAAAMSAFGKSSVFPKTLNKISHSKIFKSEDINKIELDLDKKKVDAENDSVTSSCSTSSLKSTFANKKERLTAAFATMRESALSFDNKRKPSEPGEKNTLSLSVSSATNAVRRWGANYITKRHCNDSFIPYFMTNHEVAHTPVDSEALSHTSSHLSTLGFKANKKELSNRLDDKRLDSAAFSDTITNTPLPSDKSLSVSTQDIICTPSRFRHSILEPVLPTMEQPSSVNEPFSQKTTTSYDTISSEQRPVPSLPKRISTPPQLPVRRSIEVEQCSRSLDSASVSGGMYSCKNASDQNIFKENSIKEDFEDIFESKTSKPESVSEFDDSILPQSTIKSEDTVELRDSVMSHDTLEFDDNVEPYNSFEQDDNFELEDVYLKDDFELGDGFESEDSAELERVNLNDTVNLDDTMSSSFAHGSESISLMKDNKQDPFDELEYNCDLRTGALYSELRVLNEVDELCDTYETEKRQKDIKKKNTFDHRHICILFFVIIFVLHICKRYRFFILEKSDLSMSTTKPCCVLVVGMAGSGKTTFLQRLNAHMRSKERVPYIINLGKQFYCFLTSNTYFFKLADPAVLSVPYNVNIDICDTINYKEVMKQYNLGPNGAILTSLNLFATKFDQVLSILEKKTSSHILFDTPGQIEIFTWSASGSIITDALASSFPTCIAYIIDTVRSKSCTTFMSSMLYACSILYKTKLPLIIVFNKTDVQNADFAKEWMTDFEAFQASLSKDEGNAEGEGGSGYMSSLMNSMSLMLEEFYRHLDVVAVSSITGHGMDDFLTAVEHKIEEYESKYRPELERLIKERHDRNKKEKLDNLNRLMKDIDINGEEVHIGVQAQTVSDIEDESDDDAQGIIDTDTINASEGVENRFIGTNS